MTADKLIDRHGRFAPQLPCIKTDAPGITLGIRLGIAFSIALSALCSTVAQAQVPPDAGSLKRQIEQDQRKALPDKTPSPFALPQPMKSLGGASVTVTTFRFSGNTQLSDKQLAESVKEFLNRPLDFAGLQNAALAVANAYRRGRLGGARVLAGTGCHRRHGHDSDR